MVEETRQGLRIGAGRTCVIVRDARDNRGTAHRPARRRHHGRDVVVSPGDLLTPGRVGALAAIGKVDVEVYERPRVAVLSTGNEVVEPGQPLAPGQIYDVNRYTLAAIVAAHGGVPEPHRSVHDDIDALTAALDEAPGPT